MGALLGKEADTQVANETSGLNEATKQLNLLNAQAQSLNREAQAVPIQTQQRNANTGATDAGVAPQNTAALRENALKALSIAQQADVATANYTAAKDKAQQIIDLKYKPLEASLEIRKQQYEFNKDALTAYDKKRADALGVALKKEENELNAIKTAEKEAKDLAFTLQQNGAPSEIVTKALASKSKQEIQAIAGVADYLTSKADKLDMQLKTLQIQKARQDLSGGAGLDELLSIKEAQDAGVPYGTTKRQLIAKGSSGNTAAIDKATEQFNLINDIQKNTGILGGMRGVVGANKLARLGLYNLSTFTGSESNFIASVQQLTNQQTLQSLLELKKAGGTLGALNESEGQMLRDSATKINNWAIKDKDGNVIGYNASEKDFNNELNKIKEKTQKAITAAGGTIPVEQTPEQKKELYWSSVDTLIPAVQSSAAYSSAGYNTN